jgi:hypothetical protein
VSAQKVARALGQAKGEGKVGFFEVSLQKTVKSCIDQVALFGWVLVDEWGLLFGYRLIVSVEWVDVRVRAQVCVWMIISIFGLTY